MNYHDITKDNMLNGDGLRVVLWVSGCELGCPNCQNPQTHCINSGIKFDDEAKKELWEALDHDWIAGLTLSGGHPLHPRNRFPIYILIREFKERFPNKNIWLYTGYTWEEIQHMSDALTVVEEVDVLCDGRFVESLADNTSNCKWVGSTNQRVINVQESLKQGKVVLWV